MWHRNPDNQLVEPGDRSFWMGLWKSNEFRSLLDDPSTGYMAALEQVIARPWWIISPTQDYERRHFSVWFGQSIIRRQYDNPVIEDLYYWHDLLHGLTFVDASAMDEAGWRMAMRANEIAVSMETEVLLYWRQPAMRPVSFDYDIWQDQLANGIPGSARQRLLAYRCELFRTPQSAHAQHESRLRAALPQSWLLPYDFCPTRDRPTADTLWQLRRAVSLSPSSDNHVEMELARYESQAEPFYDLWRGKWREVEIERAAFSALCRDGRWKQALARRHAVWENEANEDGIPYGDLAKAFT